MAKLDEPPDGASNNGHMPSLYAQTTYDRGGPQEGPLAKFFGKVFWDKFEQVFCSSIGSGASHPSTSAHGKLTASPPAVSALHAVSALPAVPSGRALLASLHSSLFPNWLAHPPPTAVSFRQFLSVAKKNRV